MKIIKRDGTIVDYNPEKIKIAISKANLEVEEEERASDEEIEKIIKYIEKLKKVAFATLLYFYYLCQKNLSFFVVLCYIYQILHFYYKVFAFFINL